MRQFAALMLLLTGCTATPPYAPASAGAASEPAPLWTGRGSAAGRAGIRACLDRERTEGDLPSCRPAPVRGNSEHSSASLDRVSNWAIIDDWESEMKVALSWLHANGPADDVDVAQRAWEASMLADVSVYMNMYEGGSHVGLVGSIARAEAVMDRVVFLEKLRRQIETE
jgi:hypothetical protein